MLWPDLLIIALLLFGAIRGWQLGLVRVGFETIGLVLAVVMAAMMYQMAAPWLQRGLHLIATLASLASFSLILVIVLLMYSFGVRHWEHQLHVKFHANLFNRLTGSILNVIRVVVIVTVGLIIFSGLPVSAATRSSVTSAAIPRWLLDGSGSLQGLINRGIGSDINDTVNFLTVKPASEQSLKLGFTTTGVKVDTADEAAMLNLINHERTSRGLKPLKVNHDAQLVAEAHSLDMFARGYFAHIDPDGHDPFQRMQAVGLQFSAAGENLALAPTLQLAHQGLMNSPEHKANILSPDYTSVGIGIIDGGRYGLMITQDFLD